MTRISGMSGMNIINNINSNNNLMNSSAYGNNININDQI